MNVAGVPKNGDDGDNGKHETITICTSILY